MAAWYSNTLLTLPNYLDFLLRIVVSVFCGAALGLERERRLKNAGLRTHIIVAMTATVIMIVSKYGFMDVTSLPDMRLSADTSRLAHGVVSAIGFLGAGVIFVKRETIVGLTTAAGLWATVGIGMALGSGLYGIGIITTLMILLIQWILHNHHTKTHNQISGKITCNLSSHGMTVKELEQRMTDNKITIKDIGLTKNADGQTIVRVSVLFSPEAAMIDLAAKMQGIDYVDNVELFPAI